MFVTIIFYSIYRNLLFKIRNGHMEKSSQKYGRTDYFSILPQYLPIRRAAAFYLYISGFFIRPCSYSS